MIALPAHPALADSYSVFNADRVYVSYLELVITAYSSVVCRWVGSLHGSDDSQMNDCSHMTH